MIETLASMADHLYIVHFLLAPIVLVTLFLIYHEFHALSTLLCGRPWRALWRGIALLSAIVVLAGAAALYGLNYFAIFLGMLCAALVAFAGIVFATCLPPKTFERKTRFLIVWLAVLLAFFVLSVLVASIFGFWLVAIVIVLDAVLFVLFLGMLWRANNGEAERTQHPYSAIIGGIIIAFGFLVASGFLTSLFLKVSHSEGARQDLPTLSSRQKADSEISGPLLRSRHSLHSHETDCRGHRNSIADVLIEITVPFRQKPPASGPQLNNKGVIKEVWEWFAAFAAIFTLIQVYTGTLSLRRLSTVSVHPGINYFVRQLDAFLAQVHSLAGQNPGPCAAGIEATDGQYFPLLFGYSSVFPPGLITHYSVALRIEQTYVESIKDFPAQVRLVLPIIEAQEETLIRFDGQPLALQRALDHITSQKQKLGDETVSRLKNEVVEQLRGVHVYVSLVACKAIAAFPVGILPPLPSPNPSPSSQRTPGNPQPSRNGEQQGSALPPSQQVNHETGAARNSDDTEKTDKSPHSDASPPPETATANSVKPPNAGHGAPSPSKGLPSENQTSSSPTSESDPATGGQSRPGGVPPPNRTSNPGPTSGGAAPRGEYTVVVITTEDPHEVRMFYDFLAELEKHWVT